MRYAPVMIPTLCRATHFIRLIESLKQNSWAKYTTVYIGLDYPPSKKYEKGWREIKDYLADTDWECFEAVVIIEHERNVGAVNNIRSIHERIDQKFDRWIYLEDDIEVAPNFLEYMDKCLDRYEDDSDVVAICGYSYPVEWNVSDGATCLKQNFNVSMWGTGFWQNKSKKYGEFITSKQTIKQLPTVIEEKKYHRMIDACVREYMPAACYCGIYGDKFISSCSDIGMRAYLAVDDKYVITPVISKTRNHGFDGSGLYCQNIDSTLNGNTAGTYNYSNQPIDTSINFELQENNFDNFNKNRDILNKFDLRTFEQMKKSRRLIWICENCGIFFAKAYCFMGLPFELAQRAYYKFIKR